jgi:hypothetical protein
MSTVFTAKDIEEIIAKGGDPVAASKDGILTPSANEDSVALVVFWRSFG